MNELACIRIKVSDFAGTRDSEHLRGLIGKFTEYFLDQRWRPPRRSQVVAPGCFMLSDPRAARMDVDELRELAADLQYHLFGESASGSVQIFALWGEPTELAEFSMMGEQALEDLANTRPPTGAAGRLVRIGARSPTEVRTAYRRPSDPVEAEVRPPTPSPSSTTLVDPPSFRGVYFTPQQSFFGSVLGARAEIAGQRCDLLAAGRFPSEAAELDYDLITLRQAAAVMAQGGAPGVLYVPLSFRSATTRMRLERLKPALDQLARFEKSRLAASLYATPDSAPFETVALAYEALRVVFSVVGLETTSPEFPCQAMVAGCARSVTFLNVGKSPARRLADIATFLERLHEFKAAKIWTSVGFVQSKEELDLCLKLKAPFVWGPAVTGALARPVRLDSVDEERLPYRAA